MNRAGGALLATVLATAALVVLPSTANAEPTETGFIAVGVPTADGGRGVVDLHRTDGTTDRLTPESLDLGTGSAKIRFGTSVASGDLDHDGYVDLVVGAPQGPERDDEKSVFLVFGGAEGFTADGVRRFVETGHPGDGFGTAVAINRRSDERSTGVWIGAPYATVDGHAEAGKLFQLDVHALRMPDLPAVTDLAGEFQRTEGSLMIPGSPDAGDRFGSVLANAHDGVIVGVPLEDVDGAQDAGAVYRIRENSVTGTLTTASVYTQNRAHFAGTAEAGDKFGESVSAEALAIGVPGEDIGGLTDAGTVQLSVATDEPGIAPLRAVSQDSAGVPGKAESGDRFGASVAVGRLICDDVVSAAIGSPGEDLGGAADAGTVTLVDAARAGKSCGTVGVAQGQGAPGASETGDRFGAVLSDATGADGSEDLLIGVPGESVGTVGGVGRVLVRHPTGTVSTVRPLGGDVSSLRFGTVLGRPGA
ncbi:integrin alpha [Spongisporangium articulatum]|uniref:Integrin alpha n=1 Tax=Spongisporangium articulatum TaxID=3362603 RepID=A0ABW8AQI8_9ACTN